MEPIDFEGFIAKNKTVIQQDPHRELLLYPTDDVAETVIPRKYRTITNCIPSFSQKPKNESENNNESLSSASSTTSSSNCGHSNSVQGHLLTRQALHTYESPYHVIQYKYSTYSGTCQTMPKISPADDLKEELYEVDTDPDRLDEQMTRSQAHSITKKGYLLRGPETSSEKMFANIGSKSFKRRYCCLRQEIDGTYILEFHKDEKQSEAKTTIVMDFCTEVVQNPKKGRYCFELKMSAGQHKSFILMAEDESEMDDWLRKLQKVLQQNMLQDDKRAASLERAPPPSPSTMMFGTLKGLDQSMNPQLIKYGRETDDSIAQARRENRKRLFAPHQQQLLLNTKPSNKSINIAPYLDQFGQRIILKCDTLKFRLQAPPENGDPNDPPCQLEPYLTSLALYDAKAGRKLTENFYFDLNKDHVKDLLHNETDVPHCTSPKTKDKHHANGNGTMKNGRACCTYEMDIHADIHKEWLAKAKKAIFSVTTPHPDIFVVVRIDKILQGGINQSTEPYLKATKDVKMVSKFQKTIRQYSLKCGHYRMPFAWAARPLFRLYSSDLDTSVDFPAIYRQEGGKLKDDELLKLLAEYRKPDKFSKLTVIPGTLKIYVEQMTELPNSKLKRKKNTYTENL